MKDGIDAESKNPGREGRHVGLSLLSFSTNRVGIGADHINRLRCNCKPRLAPRPFGLNEVSSRLTSPHLLVLVRQNGNECGAKPAATTSTRRVFPKLLVRLEVQLLIQNRLIASGHHPLELTAQLV
jgi:hypothetical protein